MNERIKELAEQAGIKLIPMIVDGVEYDYEDVEMDGSADLQTFAELIVKECTSLTLDYKSEPYYNGWLDYRDEIKKHFGVEE